MNSDNYLIDIKRQFHNLKELAEKAVNQISDKDFFRFIGPESNSIAIIMRHMAGTMGSRWRDFLTSDGEKPDRNRDTEFETSENDTKEAVMDEWKNGWQILFDAVEPLKPKDLEKTILIRSEPHTVIEAINRQLTHYAYHVGQIVFLARHYTGSNWQSLSIPRNKSDDFNAKMKEKFKK